MRGISTCRKHNIHNSQPLEQHETKTSKQHECKLLQKHRSLRETRKKHLFLRNYDTTLHDMFNSHVLWNTFQTGIFEKRWYNFEYVGIYDVLQSVYNFCFILSFALPIYPKTHSLYFCEEATFAEWTLHFIDYFSFIE